MSASIEKKSRELGPGYGVEIDALDEVGWHATLGQFNDANIYQTWPYDKVRGRLTSISHLVLKKEGVIAAAAQARIVKLPLIGAGIAYVRWGPLWQRKSVKPDVESFRQAIRALRNEYACKRGLVLRLRPALFRELSPSFLSILAEEGYTAGIGDTDRTLRLDLTKTTAELIAGMRPHWRRYLKVAQKNNLQIVEGSADPLFEEFISIYRQLVKRKAFAEPNDIRQFRAMQEQLPPDLKMKVLLCKMDGKVCSGLICSAMGDTAIYLYGATSNDGLKSRGSYLLHWKVIEWLKKTGITTYDLHGINPLRNPGTYKFKADLCGSNGQDVNFLGQFNSHTSIVSLSCVAFGDRLKQVVRTLSKKGIRERMGAPQDPPRAIPSMLQAAEAKKSA